MRALILTLALALPVGAAAQSQANIAKAAAGLGISEAQLRACLSAHVTPGQQPSNAQRRAIFDCLRQANPDLSTSQARSAMSALRG